VRQSQGNVWYNKKQGEPSAFLIIVSPVLLFVRVNLGEVRRNRSFFDSGYCLFNSWIGTLCIVDDLICLLLGTIRGDFFPCFVDQFIFYFCPSRCQYKIWMGKKDGSMSMRKGSACLKRTVQALEKSTEGSCVNPCADE
jgi:hypothetical protein